jgi:hypothetical protein
LGLFPRETGKHALAHVIGDKAEQANPIALGLLGIIARSEPQRGNSFEHSRDEKLCLQLRLVLGYEVSINSQTKRCLKVAGHLFLDHDLAQHRSSKALRRFPRLSNLDGHGAITAGDDSSGNN